MSDAVLDVARSVHAASNAAAALDMIADAASRAVNCPVAVVRFGGACLGSLSGIGSGPIGVSLQRDHPWVLAHADADPRTFANPLTAAALGVEFHVSVPLCAADGHYLGTLAVADRDRRMVSDEQLGSLKALARLAVEAVEMRLDMRMRAASPGPVTAAG